MNPQISICGVSIQADLPNLEFAKLGGQHSPSPQEKASSLSNKSLHNIVTEGDIDKKNFSVANMGSSTQSQRGVYPEQLVRESIHSWTKDEEGQEEREFSRQTQQLQQPSS